MAWMLHRAVPRPRPPRKKPRRTRQLQPPKSRCRLRARPVPRKPSRPPARALPPRRRWGKRHCPNRPRVPQKAHRQRPFDGSKEGGKDQGPGSTQGRREESGSDAQACRSQERLARQAKRGEQFSGAQDGAESLRMSGKRRLGYRPCRPVCCAAIFEVASRIRQIGVRASGMSSGSDAACLSPQPFGADSCTRCWCRDCNRGRSHAAHAASSSEPSARPI